MSNEKIHWKQFFPSEYLGAIDFNSKTIIATIARVESKEVVNTNNKKHIRPVVHFKENLKPLICNATNSKAISKVARSEMIQDWVNHKIELYVDHIKAFGEYTDAVRVKPTKPKVGKPELNPQHSAWNAVLDAVKGGYTREQVEQKYSVSDHVWNGIIDLTTTGEVTDGES